MSLLSQSALGDESENIKTRFNVNLNPQGLSPSAECGKCHKDIYAAWVSSIHAQATDNPVFWAAFLKANFLKGEAARKICFACHAPIAFFNEDFELSQPLTHEGINCDFCHTVSWVEPEGPVFTQHHESGLVKQGPLENARSPAHKTRFNPIYKQSLFCATCHEYQNPEGVKLLETFSEWRESPYPARNIHCQNCHMGKIPGKIVADEVKKDSGTEISSHSFAGGHSLSMREKSLDLKIVDIRINKQRVSVTVEIYNQGAGHKIPTGLPSKKIILKVIIKSKSGETLKMEQKVYQKHLQNKAGEEITDDTDSFLETGLRIISDNRIGPLEKRRERFTFFVPETRDKLVYAAVYYSHDPKIIQPTPIRIKMKEVVELVGP